MNDPFQMKLLHLQADLHTRLRGVRDARKAVIYGLRKTREIVGAKEAVIATLKAGRRANAGLLFTIPEQGDWDKELLTKYLTGKRPHIPSNTLLVPIKRQGHTWAVFGLRDEDLEFTAEHLKALFQVTQTLTYIIEVVDRNRAHEVRRKIEQKIANREDPKDLIYDILHGLRSLTHYDHSASLFIAKEGSGPLMLVAEQIAWTKAKSKRIGLSMNLDEKLRRRLRRGSVRIYKRVGNAWAHPHGDEAPLLAELLDYNASSSQAIPKEVSMLCAPIATPDGTLGVLKISARRPGILSNYEAELVEEFMPLASLAIQFSVRTEYLRERMLQSERKHVLANLARGIAHDVNNSLGAMLPLVQQIREDVSNHRLKRSDLIQDLEHIEKSVQTCRRIFGGMLSLARGSRPALGHGNLRRAIEGALSVLQDSMKRASIDIVQSIPKELPMIRGAQGDLTQLFLNICSNARDSMPNGGHLSITARAEKRTVQVTIRDTGCGMAAKALGRVFDPFFTTKADGNGLGLAICRSILWDIGGEIKIESEQGHGTNVLVSLPCLEDKGQEGAE